jgi:ABC-type sugar transport system permease subunit
MGYASALAWEAFVIIIGLTVAQFYISNRWVYYEE